MMMFRLEIESLSVGQPHSCKFLPDSHLLKSLGKIANQPPTNKTNNDSVEMKNAFPPPLVLRFDWYLNLATSTMQLHLHQLTNCEVGHRTHLLALRVFERPHQFDLFAR